MMRRGTANLVLLSPQSPSRLRRTQILLRFPLGWGAWKLVEDTQLQEI
jgi:hypothetical protein